MTKLIAVFRNFENSPKMGQQQSACTNGMNRQQFQDQCVLCSVITKSFRDLHFHQNRRYCCSLGIATGYGLDGPRDRIPVWGEIFRTCPDRPWGPPSLLYNGYRVFPGGKERPGRDADPSPPSSAAVKKE